MKQLVVVTTLVLILLAIGCGGSNSTKTTTMGQAQGVFSGTAPNGRSYTTIILPDDTFYSIYGTMTGDSLVLSGMATGKGTSSSGTYTSSVTDFYNTGSIVSGAVEAYYTAGSSINGTITENDKAVTFDGTIPSSSMFLYGTPALLSSIAGTWSGNLLDGGTAVITVSTNGTISGSNSGCPFSGTVTPDDSGKNFFRVSFTYGGDPCFLPHQTQAGIAIYHPLSNGITHELIAGIASGTSSGSVFIARR